MSLLEVLGNLFGKKDDVPYGFMVVDGEHVENPEEQKILRFIEQLSEHGYSYVSIAKRLNKGGLLGRKGRKWKAAALQKLHLASMEEKFTPTG